MKKIIIRSARKSAYLTTKALHKALSVTTRVEDKATRILTGVDGSIRLQDRVPFEKVLHNFLPHVTPLNPALPAVGSSPSVVLLIPSLDNKSFYGGTTTAILIAAKAALQTKRSLRIVQTLKAGSSAPLQDLFDRYNVPMKAEDVQVTDVSGRRHDVYGYIPMHADDLFMASAWWDAKVIQDLPLKQKFIYIIQDFEPIFYENSDKYVMAEATYFKENFVPLCNTKLMYDFMSARDYPALKDGVWFEPAPGLQGKTSDPVTKPQKRQMFFYGRPNVARNLFFTGLSSIDRVFKDGLLEADEWEVFMAGQDGIADIQLSSGVVVKNMGKMSMNDYIAFSSSIDVAVALMMAPHPNYPTLEFASLGASVVTTQYANKRDLSNYSPNIFTSRVDEEALAKAIHQAASLSDKQRAKNHKLCTVSCDWDKALDGPIREALAKVGL